MKRVLRRFLIGCFIPGFCVLTEGSAVSPSEECAAGAATFDLIVPAERRTTEVGRAATDHGLAREIEMMELTQGRPVRPRSTFVYPPQHHLLPWWDRLMQSWLQSWRRKNQSEQEAPLHIEALMRADVERSRSVGRGSMDAASLPEWMGGDVLCQFCHLPSGDRDALHAIWNMEMS